MYKKFFTVFILTAFVILPIVVYSSRESKIHPLLKEVPSSEDCKVWITFKDKPDFRKSDINLLEEYEKVMSSRTLKRRKHRTEYDKPDFTDFPVSECYIKKVLSVGAVHRTTSRWLNAVSIEISIDKLEEVSHFDFVSSIEPVITYIQKIPKFKSSSPSYSAPYLEHKKIEYGESYKQIEQIKVDMLHKKGYHGEDILIGLLDTGFNLSHRAFSDIDVVEERDFIYNDQNTADQDKQDDEGQDSHGTYVLSVIAGNASGHLIGTAFSASYLLGKTEKVSENGVFFERRIEEDWWIEGIEWMELMGVDVVNSSLGYSDWYKFSDLDGNTAKITKAANLAVEKGVVVVIAAGNQGSNKSNEIGLEGHINPPADGFDVLAVGAVDSQGNIVSFSSRGPTYDGRIKPELVAMGKDTVVVDPKTLYAYTRMNGTSVSSPLITGAAALLLQAFPNAKSKQIIEVLKKTASMAESPNNDYGWGIANVQAAYDFLLEKFASSDLIAVSVSNMAKENSHWGIIKSQLIESSLEQNYPNPFNPDTWIPFILGSDANVAVSIYNIRGQLVRDFQLGYLPAGIYIDQDRALYWNGLNQYGESVTSGQYFYELKAGDFSAMRKMIIVK